MVSIYYIPVLVLVLTGLVAGVGKCPYTSGPNRYRCNCEGGRFEEYTSNEALLKARADPDSCCYITPEPVCMEDDSPYGSWQLVRGKWCKVASEETVLSRWLAFINRGKND